MFFSEEKNQKTFVLVLVDRYGTWPDGWVVLKICLPVAARNPTLILPRRGRGFGELPFL
jgi:hypothetical protein